MTHNANNNLNLFITYIFTIIISVKYINYNINKNKWPIIYKIVHIYKLFING